MLDLMDYVIRSKSFRVCPTSLMTCVGLNNDIVSARVSSIGSLDPMNSFLIRSKAMGPTSGVY